MIKHRRKRQWKRRALIMKIIDYKKYIMCVCVFLCKSNYWYLVNLHNAICFHTCLPITECWWFTNLYSVLNVGRIQGYSCLPHCIFFFFYVCVWLNLISSMSMRPIFLVQKYKISSINPQITTYSLSFLSVFLSLLSFQKHLNFLSIYSLLSSHS